MFPGEASYNDMELNSFLVLGKRALLGPSTPGGSDVAGLKLVSQCLWQSLSGPVSPQVMVNNGFTPDRNDYEFCAKVENMVIPAQGHFGVSAATGGLAGKPPPHHPRDTVCFGAGSIRLITASSESVLAPSSWGWHLSCAQGHGGPMDDVLHTQVSVAERLTAVSW